MAHFQMDMEQLRAAFVKARLAEEQYYGMPDVMRWLMHERNDATSPDDAVWGRLLAGSDEMLFAANGKEIETLREHASPSDHIPTGPFEFDREIEHRSRIAPLLKGLNSKFVSVYYGILHGPIVVCKSSNGLVDVAYQLWQEYDANGKPFTSIKPVTSVAVMDAVYATWLRGAPNAGKAREFLCIKLVQAICKDETAAIKEFARAVAVTEGGRKILHADWVLVRHHRPPEAGYTYSLHNGEIFHSGKIIRNERLIRDKVRIPTSASLTVNDIRINFGIQTLIKTLPYMQQMFLECTGWDDFRANLFITDEEYCPATSKVFNVELFQIG